MKKKADKIQTERLVLAPYQDCDMEDMIDLLSNEEIKKTFMIPDFATREEAIKMFHRVKELSYSEEHFEYGVYLDNCLIGFINDVETDEESIEIGYVIHPNKMNHGYATEVLNASIQELFRIGYKVVRAGLFEENVASSRVMEKCGMVRIDKTDEIKYQGISHHCIYYQIASEQLSNIN